ncbi:hypothetical protein D3C81_2261280 [compost metagenome]
MQLQTIDNDIEANTKYGNITIITQVAPEAIQTNLRSGLGKESILLPNVKDGSIGTGGPNVKLTSEVGDLALLMANN